MTLRVLNDTHIGAIRSAGTTIKSQLELRKHILQRFEQLLPDEGDLLINGDLFDSYSAPIVDVLSTYEILADWLHAHPTSVLYNSAGNHDLGKTNTIMSSFQFLGKLLSRLFSERYVHIEQPKEIPYGYVIPHLANQELFNNALSKIPACRRLFLHCNLGNKFAETADQSLNLSLAVLDSLPCSEVILGHEHKSRTVGRALVVGNQIPTSVADWLGTDTDKYYAEVGSSTTLHLCSERNKEFIQLDWQNLKVTEHKFVQVTGSAESAQAFEVVSSINKFRKVSDAFVVANAVEVRTDDGTVFSANLESVKAFSILQCLKESLTDKEFAKIKGVHECFNH